MTASVQVSPEMAAELEFQPGCEVSHDGSSLGIITSRRTGERLPPCELPATWFGAGHPGHGKDWFALLCDEHHEFFVTQPKLTCTMHGRMPPARFFTSWVRL